MNQKQCTAYILVLDRGKKWNENLVKPELDYSEIYEEDLGQIPGGLTIELPFVMFYWESPLECIFNKFC